MLLLLLLAVVVVVVVVVAVVVAVLRPRLTSMLLCSPLGQFGEEDSSGGRALGGGRVVIRSHIFEQNFYMPWGYDKATPCYF